jgi:hypothetical protein
MSRLAPAPVARHPSAVTPAPAVLPWGRTIPPLLAVATVYAVALTMLRSGAIAAKPTLISAAIAFDLILTTSAAVWWLGVRRAGWPRWTVAVTFGLGSFASRMLLPGSIVVTALIGLWLAIEAVLAVIALTKIRTIVRAARAHRGPGPIAAIEAGLLAAKAPPRLATIVATDVVSIGLGLAGWFRRAPVGPDLFSMHRRKSWGAIIGVFLLLIAVETVAVHLLLASWSVIAAWIATGLSIYSAMWFAADLHVLRLYPLRVEPDAIHAAVGVRWRVTIPRDAISSVVLADSVPDGALNATVLEPTVVVTLNRPIEIRGLFGIKRTPTTIALTVDEPERLIARLGG